MNFLFAIIGAFGAIASVVSLVFYFPPPSKWRHVIRAIKTIIRKIKIDGFEPDIVVTYGRGGAIIGGLLAGNLGSLPILGIDREVIQLSDKRIKLINTNALPILKGKKVLLVTGEVITGNRLLLTKNTILIEEPQEIKTVSYYVCKSSETFPNYFYRETDHPIKVPWRLTDDYMDKSKPGLQTRTI